MDSFLHQSATVLDPMLLFYFYPRFKIFFRLIQSLCLSTCGIVGVVCGEGRGPSPQTPQIFTANVD